jgi:hypothetical protein
MSVPTDKQNGNLEKLINNLGIGVVSAYFYKFYPNGNFDKMTRGQCQKMWTGLSSKLPYKGPFGKVSRTFYHNYVDI